MKGCASYLTPALFFVSQFFHTFKIEKQFVRFSAENHKIKFKSFRNLECGFHSGCKAHPCLGNLRSSKDPSHHVLSRPIIGDRTCLDAQFRVSALKEDERRI